MVRAADADSLKPGGGAQGHNGLSRQDHRERAGPELFGQGVGRVGDVLTIAGEPRAVRHVDDERVILRAALGQEDVQDRVLIQRIRTKAVDGLGRDGEKTAVPDDLCRRLNILFCGFFKINSFQMDSFLLFDMW